jgi:class 3 adenylate cyclase
MRAVGEWDVEELLPQVRAPTLVTHRKGDRYVSVDVGRRIAASIPNAQLALFDGVAGGMSRDARDAVIDFMAGSPEAGRQVRARYFTSAPRPAAAPAVAPGPSGVHTILFTDLVSSTALTNRLGDAKMQELLRTHDAVVREALRASGGREIKHTGDGIMASFGTASAALECAQAIARGVAGRNDANLQVHIGLNAGEPVAERDDLYGASVQLARRLCDHSEPGQIVVADVVRQLALGKGFSFAALPEAPLKGFDEPVRAHELVWRRDAPSAPDGLTAREVEVLRLIAAGRTNTEIASELTLSVRTVARHITNIYTKIGARNKAEATDYVHRNRLN